MTVVTPAARRPNTPAATHLAAPCDSRGPWSRPVGPLQQGVHDEPGEERRDEVVVKAEEEESGEENPGSLLEARCGRWRGERHGPRFARLHRIDYPGEGYALREKARRVSPAGLSFPSVGRAVSP